MLNTLHMILENPYEDRLQTSIEFFNEFCVGSCSLMFMLMTDYMETYELKRAAGWGLVGITLLNLAINTLIAIGMSLYEVVRRVRRAIGRC